MKKITPSHVIIKLPRSSGGKKQKTKNKQTNKKPQTTKPPKQPEGRDTELKKTRLRLCQIFHQKQ